MEGKSISTGPRLDCLTFSNLYVLAERQKGEGVLVPICGSTARPQSNLVVYHTPCPPWSKARKSILELLQSVHNMKSPHNNTLSSSP